MATIQVPALNAASTPPSSGDLVHLRQGSEDKKISLTDLFGNIPVNTSVSGTITSSSTLSTTNGNIIATSNSAAASDIEARNTEGRVRLRANDGDAFLSVLDNAGANEEVFIQYDSSANSIIFSQNNIEAARLDSNGLSIADRLTVADAVSVTDGYIISAKVDTSTAFVDVRNTEGRGRLASNDGDTYLSSLDNAGANEETFLLYDRSVHDVLVRQNNTLVGTFSASGLDIVGEIEAVQSGQTATICQITTTDNTVGFQALNTSTNMGFVMYCSATSGDVVLYKSDGAGTTTERILAYDRSSEDLLLYQGNVERARTSSSGLDVTGNVTGTAAPSSANDLTRKDYTDGLVTQSSAWSGSASSGSHTISSIADCGLVMIEVHMNGVSEYVWHSIPRDGLVIGRTYILDATAATYADHYAVGIRFDSNTQFTVVSSDAAAQVTKIYRYGKLRT